MDDHPRLGFQIRLPHRGTIPGEHERLDSSLLHLPIAETSSGIGRAVEQMQITGSGLMMCSEIESVIIRQTESMRDHACMILAAM